MKKMVKSSDFIKTLKNKDENLEKLNVLNNMDGRFNSNEFASSGDQSSAKLYEIIKKKVITLFNF